MTNSEKLTPLELAETYEACKAAYKYHGSGMNFDIWINRPHCAWIIKLSIKEIIELGKEVKKRYEESERFTIEIVESETKEQ